MAGRAASVFSGAPGSPSESCSRKMVPGSAASRIRSAIKSGVASCSQSRAPAVQSVRRMPRREVSIHEDLGEHPGHRPVAVAMAGELVPGVGHGLRQVRPLPDVHPQHEERGPLAFERGQEPFGVPGIGAVIEGEGDQWLVSPDSPEDHRAETVPDKGDGSEPDAPIDADRGKHRAGDDGCVSGGLPQAVLLRKVPCVIRRAGPAFGW